MLQCFWILREILRLFTFTIFYISPSLDFVFTEDEIRYFIIVLHFPIWRLTIKYIIKTAVYHTFGQDLSAGKVCKLSHLKYIQVHCKLYSLYQMESFVLFLPYTYKIKLQKLYLTYLSIGTVRVMVGRQGGGRGLRPSGGGVSVKRAGDFPSN